MYEAGMIKVFGDIGTPEVAKSLVQLQKFIGQAPKGDIVAAALMPDCHLGYSVPIGSVFESKEYVILV